MHDDRVRREWRDCNECGEPTMWLRVDVMDGVVIYGLIHRDEWVDCRRNVRLNMVDFRNSIEGSDHTL